MRDQLTSYDIIFDHIDPIIANKFKKLNEREYNLYYPLMLDLAKKLSELTHHLTNQNYTNKKGQSMSKEKKLPADQCIEIAKLAVSISSKEIDDVVKTFNVLYNTVSEKSYDSREE